MSMSNRTPWTIAKSAGAALILATLAACGGDGSAGASEPAAGPTGAPNSPSAWTRLDDTPGACCNYASLALTDQGALRIYSNSTGSLSGSLFLYEGDFSGVALTGSALSVADPADAYIRTVAIARRGGAWQALLYTGTGYPSANGFSPSWAESSDGVHWTWLGPVSPYPRALSSGQALVVDERGYFRAWLDDVGGTLREMSSLDGRHWNDEGDMWPASLPPGQAVFPNATKTARGTMLAVADAWPATKIRTLWRCDGGSWRVLEDPAPIGNGVKGTALLWDGSRVHAYANGAHWTRPEPTCP